jgi:hypothetical protein
MQKKFEKGYALVVGIANYPKVRKLKEAVLKDAKDIHNLFLSSEHCGYIEENCHLLLDGEASSDNIRYQLKWLSESTSSDSTVLFYFSGHGGRIEKEQQAVNYLIPYDCDPNNIENTAISDNEITALLHNIRAERLLVLFDCCHSGGIGDAKNLISESEFKSGLNESYYEKLAQGKGRVIIASSRSDEVSLILPDMPNSLFTHYLLKSLKGDMPTRGDGLIRVFEVFEYISENVPKRAQQHPIFKASEMENNFPIALEAGGKSLKPDTPDQTPSDPANNIEIYTMNIQQKSELVKTLLQCASIKDKETRNAIINELPPNIRNTIQRHSVDIVDVNNLITRCNDFTNGIKQLTDILRMFEGDAVGMQNVDALLKSLRKS